MLSYNFGLVRKSYLREIPLTTLLLIFLIIYIDFYDLALYAGYAIYLRPILLPKYAIYNFTPLITFTFLLGQVAKVIGFYIGYCIKRSDKIVNTPLIGLIISFMIMILFPTYQVVGSFALLYFIMARMLIIFFFGMQLAYIVQLANHESLKHKNKLPMYVFLLLSSEIGILVSIFVNRLMISHGVSLVHFEDALRLQLLLNMILVVACLKLKSMNKFNEQLGFNFRRDKLYVLIKHNYKYIFLRTVLISYSALLMVMVIIRIPNTLHVYWGWTQNNVNVVTIQITVLGFIGSYLMKICTKYLNPARLMMIMYLISVVENIIYLYGNLLFAGTFNYYWLLSMGLFYGAFLRLTPLILFDMKDFNPRQQLIGRFISFLLAYVVVIGITLFFIDASYFVYQSDRVPTVLYTLVIVAIFGIISLWAKSKYYANL